MRTGSVQSPMNGSVTPRHDEDVTLSNPPSTNNKDGLYRSVFQVVPSNSTPTAVRPAASIIRTSQGQFLLLAASGPNVQGLPFSQGNIAAVQIPQLINNVPSASTAVPPDPVPPSTPILRHPTPPPPFMSSPGQTPQPQVLAPSTTGVSNSSTSGLPVQFVVTSASAPVVGHNVVIGPSTPSSGGSTPNVSSPAATSQEQNYDADKKKCINFLKTLLNLAKKRGDGKGSVVEDVNNLVLGLLGGRVTPQNFTDKIQAVLNSKPQPHLLPFLESMLPHVQHAYRVGEFALEGLNGPTINSSPAPMRQPTTSNAPSPTIQQQYQMPQSMPSYISQPPPPTVSTIRTLIPASNSASTAVIMGNNATILTAAPIAGPYVVASSMRPMMQAGVGLQQPSSRFQYPSVAQQLASGAAGGAPAPMPSAALQRHLAPARPPAPTAAKGPAGLTTSANAVPGQRPPRPHPKAAGSKGQHPQPPATPEKYREPEDDINDVAAMGGVNLAEESQKIMASTAEILSTETRSCGKDEDFLFGGPLASKIRAISHKYGLQDARPEVLSLVSHATQERLKDLVEKLALIAEHRTEPLRNNPLYDQVSDVRSQIRFLDELSKKDYMRREEREKEMVMRMAKSRSSKLGDSEQQRMKERAKELQKAEQEEMRNRDANAAAQLALSSLRKRPAAAMSATHAMDASTASANPLSSGPAASGSTDTPFRTPAKPRYKRVNLRDLQLLLRQEREGRQSKTFYRSFYK